MYERRGSVPDAAVEGRYEGDAAAGHEASLHAHAAGGHVERAPEYILTCSFARWSFQFVCLLSRTVLNRLRQDSRCGILNLRLVRSGSGWRRRETGNVRLARGGRCESRGTQMWDLEASRARFYSELGIPPQNFWKWLFKSAGKGELLADARYELFFSWTPDQANCPELEEVIRRMTAVAPNYWKATMRNIFVARTGKGEANAAAWSFSRSGVVELNYGFTVAAMIYATLFSQFYDGIATIAADVDLSMPEGDILWDILEEVDRGVSDPILVADSSIEPWRRNGSIFAAHPALLERPMRTTLDGYYEAVSAIEEFAVAHEVSHHMLGHTEVSFRKSRDVARHVDRWIARLGLSDLLGELNESQRQEVQADVAAFLLISGELGGESDRILLYRAILGSMLGLVALAHISEDWSVTDPDATHPDFITRYSVISGLIVKISKSVPQGDLGDHPLGLLLQLRGFASMVLQTWLSRNKDGVQRPHFVNIFAWMADEAERLGDQRRAAASS